MGQKNKKNVDLLTTQHPRFRLRTRKVLLRNLGLAAVITTLLSFSGWYLISKYAALTLQAQQTLSSENQLQVVIDSEKPQALSDFEKDQLRQQIPRLIKAIPHFTLQQLAQKLLVNSSYQEVLLLQPNREKLYVKITKRVPVLITTADHPRFISAQGEIYGLLLPEESASNPLPHFSGLFTDDARQFTLTTHNSLLVTAFEEQILREATALTQVLQAEKLPITTIEFIMHRGFLCQLAVSGTTVAFGRAPFEKKIAKLNKVLAHLTEKGTRAQRIELDYIGKAFIKEKLQ